MRRLTLALLEGFGFLAILASDASGSGDQAGFTAGAASTPTLIHGSPPHLPASETQSAFTVPISPLATAPGAGPQLVAAPAASPGIPEALPGDILVSFRVEAKAWAGEPGKHPDVEEIFRGFPAKGIEALLPRARGRLGQLYHARLENPGDTASDLRRLRASKQVRYSDANGIYTTTATSPDDPDLGLQWHLENNGQTGGTPGADINAPAAWDLETGNRNVVIAVIDTGVDYDHPDLSGNIWHNPGETGEGKEMNGVDDDSNGFIDDHIGWDFVSIDRSFVPPWEDPEPPDNDPADFQGHGTFTSGVAAAVGNNATGGSGVAWESSIMVLRAGFANWGGGGSLLYSDVVEAIEYATANGADIISMSFGGASSLAISDALLDAYEAGVVLIASAGNSGLSGPNYPAALPFVLSVSATDHDDRPAAFTTYGAWVDVAAPGVDIYGPSIRYSHRIASGTSASCPIVAGIAALCLSRTPALTNEEIYQILRSTADSPDSSVYLGVGRVNAAAAISRRATASAALDPGLDELVVAVSSMEIRGTASASYNLYYGEGAYPRHWISIADGDGEADGLLATWMMDSVESAGTYSLRLVVAEGTDEQAEDRTVLRIDPTLMPGWPRTIPADGSFKQIYASPIVADLDNDGSNELFAISYIGRAYLWNPDGTVVPGWPKVPGVDQDQLVMGSPAVANIDGGEDLEIVVATGLDPESFVNVWKHDGSSAAGWPQSLGHLGYLALGGAVAGDIDGDGNAEIIAASWNIFGTGVTRIHVWHHDGTVAAGWPRLYPRDLIAGSPVSLADMDGDGDLDIVATAWIYAGLDSVTRVMVLDESGAMLPGWPQQRPGGSYSGVSIGDVDGDGDPELFFQASLNHMNGLDHLGNDLPGWPPNQCCSVSSTPALGDLDGDGDLEIAYNALGGMTYLYDHQGDLLPGWPLDTSNLFVSRGGPVSSVTIADINGNGQPDILFGGAGTSMLHAYDVDGLSLDGFPKEIDFNFVPDVVATPEITDLDGDGAVDIVLAGTDGRVYVWKMTAPVDRTTELWPRFQNQMARHGRHEPDCNGNGEPDPQDVGSGASQDCDADGVPDECQMDGDADGIIDACDPCPELYNPGQSDLGLGRADLCPPAHGLGS